MGEAMTQKRGIAISKDMLVVAVDSKHQSSMLVSVVSTKKRRSKLVIRNTNVTVDDKSNTSKCNDNCFLSSPTLNSVQWTIDSVPVTSLGSYYVSNCSSSSSSSCCCGSTYRRKHSRRWNSKQQQQSQFVVVLSIVCLIITMSCTCNGWVITTRLETIHKVSSHENTKHSESLHQQQQQQQQQPRTKILSKHTQLQSYCRGDNQQSYEQQFNYKKNNNNGYQQYDNQYYSNNDNTINDNNNIYSEVIPTVYDRFVELLLNDDNTDQNSNTNIIIERGLNYNQPTNVALALLSSNNNGQQQFYNGRVGNVGYEKVRSLGCGSNTYVQTQAVLVNTNTWLVQSMDGISDSLINRGVLSLLSDLITGCTVIDVISFDIKSILKSDGLSFLLPSFVQCFIAAYETIQYQLQQQTSIVIGAPADTSSNTYHVAPTARTTATATATTTTKDPLQVQQKSDEQQRYQQQQKEERSQQRRQYATTASPSPSFFNEYEMLQQQSKLNDLLASSSSSSTTHDTGSNGSSRGGGSTTYSRTTTTSVGVGGVGISGTSHRRISSHRILQNQQQYQQTQQLRAKTSSGNNNNNNRKQYNYSVGQAVSSFQPLVSLGVTTGSSSSMHDHNDDNIGETTVIQAEKQQPDYSQLRMGQPISSIIPKSSSSSTTPTNFVDVSSTRNDNNNIEQDISRVKANDIVSSLLSNVEAVGGTPSSMLTNNIERLSNQFMDRSTDTILKLFVQKGVNYLVHVDDNNNNAEQKAMPNYDMHLILNNPTVYGYERVTGCTSNVCIRTILESRYVDDDEVNPVWYVSRIDGVSDAIVSRGIVACMAELLTNCTANEVIEYTQPQRLTQQLYIDDAFVSSGRNDGFANIYRTIQQQLRTFISTVVSDEKSTGSTSSDVVESSQDDRPPSVSGIAVHAEHLPESSVLSNNENLSESSSKSSHTTTDTPVLNQFANSLVELNIQRLSAHFIGQSGDTILNLFQRKGSELLQQPMSKGSIPLLYDKVSGSCCSSDLYVRTITKQKHSDTNSRSSSTEDEWIVDNFDGISESIIARGIILCIKRIVEGCTADEVLAIDPTTVSSKLGIPSIAMSKINSNTDIVAEVFRTIQTHIQRQTVVFENDVDDAMKAQQQKGFFDVAVTSSKPLQAPSQQSNNPVVESVSLQMDDTSLRDSTALKESTTLVVRRNKKRVALLLSGGVDSSVALHLLVQGGYNVTAYYLRIWLEDELQHLGSCPWEEDFKMCQEVVAHAESTHGVTIPLKSLSLQQQYQDRVIQHTIEEARSGRTPNPDVLCNSRVKFGCFYDAIFGSDDNNQHNVPIDGHYDYVATGHYAQVSRFVDGIAVDESSDSDDDSNNNAIVKLRRAPDQVKDQTYFLCALSQKQLSKCMFPIGKYEKNQVRQIADELGMPNRHRPDSQGLCFLGKVKFDQFLSMYLGTDPGPIMDACTGDYLGQHNGIWYHTVGQRKGIGKVLTPKATSRGPWYVVAKDTTTNTIYCSNKYDDDEAFVKPRSEIAVENVHWISGVPPFAPVQIQDQISVDASNISYRFEMKIRHGPKIANGRLQLRTSTSSSGDVILDEKDGGLAPGQYIVFYSETDGQCLGSGIISEKHWTSFILQQESAAW